MLPLRAAFAAEKAGKLVPYTHAMFRAYWAEGRDISDPAVVADVATRAGLDGAALVAEAPAYKDALKAQTQEAVDRGSFGAPTFFVGRGDVRRQRPARLRGRGPGGRRRADAGPRA